MTSAASPSVHPYPFNRSEGLALDDAYRSAQHRPGMVRVRLPFGEPAWLATRYEDARLVLGDRRFSTGTARERDAPRLRKSRIGGGILQTDPPEHTRLRTLVAKAFTARRVEDLRPRIRALAEDLVDGMVAAGPPADLVEDFALPLPVGVICELLGVPVEDRPRFRRWSDDLLSTSGLTEREFQRSFEELRAYLADLVAQHRAHPADDLMSALIAARDERDRLNETELIDLCAAVLVAGHETTATQIPNFVLVLLEHPRELAELREREELIPAAVEELMRYVPLGSAGSFARYATEDVRVGEVLVRAGEPVLVAIGAANRDGSHFEAPDELRFDRPRQHIGFGHGVHHCLGAQLARAELQEALRVLLFRLPGLRLAGDVEWKSRMLVRGPRTMPIGW
ncbi:cytochrome P450 [Streptomyces sp. TRM43335]|uniref:Cytochrome P450 n=1 Tax=Streptomyces taklimakanensis TaxID=2569853 RepID=A0A6G2B6P8_9ACTN|nr:cytochrome P450 [Streptomyces taklimakanensis]MTE17806.1 cytochrome P450 [Streptomyces taklimakanensis]